jgi:hypothetical protein
MSPLRNPLGWHLVAIVGVSAAFESLFIHHGIAWLFDEGWPLYAAMQLHDGGVLYQDILFPFPPGHLLLAWVAYGLDPPGVVLARVFYAAFCVALNVSVYFLARRLTTPTFALLAALLIAIAAPRSHLSQLLFAYRYFVLAIVVLLAFAERLRTDEPREARRWMFLAGAAAGVALIFRLTPAFAVSCGIGLAVITASTDWRTWVRDWVAYGVGLAVVTLPVLGYFAVSVGLDVLWREVVTRIVALQGAQSLPSPPLSWLPASGDRGDVYRWFVALQYRLYIVLYAGYAVGLVVQWLRARRESRAFVHSLLLAIVVAGGIYLLRAIGRSDDHHLMSARPPVCLGLAHGVGALAARAPSLPKIPLVVLLVAGWAYLMNVDHYFDERTRGRIPLRVTDGEILVNRKPVARRVDGVSQFIADLTEEGDVVLDLSGAPLFHPLTGRRGPGVLDVITPGIFLSGEDEERFVEHLREHPPRAVIWPAANFDRRADRSIEQVAPRVTAWVSENYTETASVDRYRIFLSRSPSP